MGNLKMNCTTFLVLVIALFSLVVHADEVKDHNVEKVGADGVTVPEDTTQAPPTGTPTAAGDKDGEKTTKASSTASSAAAVTQSTDEETTKAINGSNAGCGSLSLAVVVVMVLSRWIM